MDKLKGKKIMFWIFMGNARMYEALRDNTGGAQDKFLSEIVRIMEKYPCCNGIDIDLERGGDYSTADISTAMFRNIYNKVKAYDASKVMNICLPGMTSVNGSVGGENWCVYGHLNNYCDTASIMTYGWNWQIYDKTYRGVSSTYYAAKLWMTGGYNGRNYLTAYAKEQHAEFGDILIISLSLLAYAAELHLQMKSGTH